MAEIQRRSAEYDAGEVETIPWEQVKAEARLRAGNAEFNLVRANTSRRG